MSILLAKTVETKNFELSEGLLYALIGFVLVLLVLAVLMGFIYLLSYIVRKFEARKAAKASQDSEPASDTAPELAPGSSGNVKLFNVDDRTAAMVMAIVADEMKTPLNELRFISIKEITPDQTNNLSKSIEEAK